MNSRIAALLFLCVSFLWGSLGVLAEENTTVMVFGDSLSAAYGMEEHEGWVQLLANRLNSEPLRATVVNGSVGGETTTGGLARLPAMLESYEPDIVVLELGGNDGLRGLPIQSMRENLQAMIDLIHNSDAKVLLAGIQIPPNYGPRYTEPFYATFSALAEENQLRLVPFLIDGIPQQPELMQDDGIHPKAEAQSIILENVWRQLKSMLMVE